MKFFAKLIFPVTWTLIIAFLLCLPGSMIPNEQGFQIPQFDKIVHISLFGGFVFLWSLFCTRFDHTTVKRLQLFFIIYVLANAYGIGMEYVQKYYIPLRDFSPEDIIADMIGAGLAYGIANSFLINFPKK